VRFACLAAHVRHAAFAITQVRKPSLTASQLPLSLPSTSLSNGLLEE
jgi:hypothetical protein